MKKRLVIVIFSIMAAALLTLGIVYVASEKRSPEIEKKSQKDGEDKTSEDISQEERSLTFLVMGLDDGTRTDVLMVCKYFEDTGKFSLLSIPRDTLVEIPGYGQENINHAHVYGGPELTVETVNNLLDMDIEYYIRADFKLIEEIVDTVGGVELYVPDGIYGLKEGQQTLNGEEAVVFLRHRKTYPNQDLGRIAAQQTFVKSMVLKMSETASLSNAVAFVKSGVDNADTNIPLKDRLYYILKLKDLDLEKLDMEMLPGYHEFIDRVSHIIVYEDQLPELVERMFINEEIETGDSGQ